MPRIEGPMDLEISYRDGEIVQLQALSATIVLDHYFDTIERRIKTITTNITLEGLSQPLPDKAEVPIDEIERVIKAPKFPEDKTK